MSAFDLYKGDLCRKMEFDLPKSFDEERRLWIHLSKIMIYRQGGWNNINEWLTKIDAFRKKP